MAPKQTTISSSERSLLIIVLDVTASAWGGRDLKRNASDRQRAEAGKRTVGPCNLQELLSSIISLCSAFSCLNRENIVTIIAVAGDECAIVYPRKSCGDDNSGISMGNIVNDPPITSKINTRFVHDYLKLGVAELVARDVAKAEQMSSNYNNNIDNNTTNSSNHAKGAAITSALSTALCVINRFMVAAHSGVSALVTEDMLRRQEDEGILSLLNSSESDNSNTAQKIEEQEAQHRRLRGISSPRILIVQATEDRTRDYNAFMNCTFAAKKAKITIDGCFIPSGIQGEPKTSSFLEQACDRTQGVFLAPPGPAQALGALTEVMISVFLSPLSIRKYLNLPILSKVDFRSRCFETGESLDIAFVCNQCLSIFKNKPKEKCPTCNAMVYVATDNTTTATATSSDNNHKKSKV